MVTMADMILFIGLLILVALILTFTIRLARRGIHILANPPLNLVVFLFAKILAFVSCLFIPLGVLWPELKWYSIPGYLSWLAPGLFVTGSLLAITAMKKLGDDLIFGLPDGDISHLQTEGIYKISRNPLYLGFFMIIVASWLSVPNPFNIGAGGIAIVIHHVIILKEERFLIAKNGSEYLAYMRKTGRYLFA
jgi:protein-S-isoprenylcysteine O-methyltransferase Ste14